jgi:cell division protein ZapB
LPNCGGGGQSGSAILNWLTTIRLPLYSGGMISDFDLLSQKVDELARLAHALRRENASLRASLAVAGAEHDELVRRMQLAQERVMALLARLPVAPELSDHDDDHGEEHDDLHGADDLDVTAASDKQVA